MFTLEKYQEFGMASPFHLSNSFEKVDFEKEYFEFQRKSMDTFGTKVTVKPNLLSCFFDSIAFDNEILSRVKKIIGPDVYIWSSAIFAKAPGEGKIVSFHQDNPYWQLTSTEVVTAWVALTSSNKKSGAMQIVPGSHKYGLISGLDVSNPREAYLNGEKTTSKDDLLSYKHDLDDFLSKNPAITIDLSPGSFSLHHIDAVHGSGTNKSDNYRIGYAIRYISSNTKHIMEASDSALHVFGEKNVYFKDEIRPKQDFDFDAIDCYKTAMGSSGAFGNKKYG